MPHLPFLLLSSLFLLSSFGEETVDVNPGDDIQSAIDKLHSGNGGRVVFHEGTYTINKMILVYSNITLMGDLSVDKSKIVIQLDPNDLTYNEYMVGNNGENTTNLWIENLSFLGNIQPSEQLYPPCCLECSKNCSGKTANDTGCSCLNTCNNMRTNQIGVGMGGGGDSIDTAYNFNYTIKNIIVTHCAMGITASGWRTLHVQDVETHSNGMIQAYYHNIYFRRNYNITISNLYSHDSPTGNGINMSQSSYIVVFFSTFLNNYWRGLRVEGEEGYIWTNIWIYNNTANNNGDYGFRFANGDNGLVEYNTAKNNTPSNLYKGNLHNVTFYDNDGF